MSGARYSIRTVADFLTVPADRRAVCLREFYQWIEIVEATRAIVAAIEGFEATNDPADAFEWIDDDKHEATIRFQEEGGEELARAVVKMGAPK